MLGEFNFASYQIQHHPTSWVVQITLCHFFSSRNDPLHKKLVLTQDIDIEFQACCKACLAVAYTLISSPTYFLLFFLLLYFIFVKNLLLHYRLCVKFVRYKVKAWVQAGWPSQASNKKKIEGRRRKYYQY